MEGEGRSFRVLGFNQNQRALFVQILMRCVLSLMLITWHLEFWLNIYFIKSTPKLALLVLYILSSFSLVAVLCPK